MGTGNCRPFDIICEILLKKCSKVLVNKNKCLPLYRDKEITQRPGPVPGNRNDKENENIGRTQSVLRNLQRPL